MILRRFMKHVTEQNWFAVGLDVIVVIVGIFLGLQVQAWYDRQNDLDVEGRTVGYLITDIENTIAQLTRAKMRFEMVIDAETKVLQFLEQDNLSEEDRPAFERSVYEIAKNPPIEGFFNGFTDDNLAKLQNETLKRIIASYLDSKNASLNMVDMIYRNRFPNSGPVIMDKALISEETSIGVIKMYDFDALKNDQDYKRAVGYILNDTIVLQRVVLRLISDSDALLEILKKYQVDQQIESYSFAPMGLNSTQTEQ